MKTTPLPDDLLAPALARQVDLVCDRFEAALRRGERPRIEDLLREAGDSDRELLLQELLALEIAYRPGAPQEDDYRARFAAYPRVLATLGAASDPANGVTTAFAEALPPIMPAATPWPCLPGYEILAEVARGGMGVVYRARQLSLGRIVALKTCISERVDPARFRGEAEAAARLEHPHIVRIYDCGECQGMPFITMEFVDGPTLAQQLAAGRCQPAEAAGLIEVLARTMDEAHRRQVVHRDLKPGNILLQRPGPGAGLWGVPKIADFGLAKRLYLDRDQTLGETVLGTASYMAPEQAAGKTKSIGPAADIYALGAILYEMLTGKPPFRGDNLLATLDQVRTQRPAPPTQGPQDVPKGLADICLRCLEKDPARRYPSAAALAEALRDWQQASANGVKPDTGRRRRLLAWLSVGLIPLMLWAAFGGHRSYFPQTSPTTASPPATSALTAATAHDLELRIAHFRGAEAVPLGRIGVLSFAARVDDDVRVEVRFPTPSYCYLLALNPDGNQQLCYPTDDTTAPARAASLDYPPDRNRYFGLTDGAGMQAFVLVAAQQPLPAYADWRSRQGAVPWRTSQAEGVWSYDGEQLKQLGIERGQERVRGQTPPALVELVKSLQARRGQVSVQVLAFPVK
ncbi:MAG: serine/threonine protein kinase [Planctomycetia bacterium]|nr:serine/threonine protein kinase [Planctomycetia bacterium]